MSELFGFGMAGGNGGTASESQGERDARVAETVRQMADCLFVRQTVEASAVLQALAASHEADKDDLMQRVYASESTWADADALEAAQLAEWQAVFVAEAAIQQRQQDDRNAAYAAELAARDES